MNSKVSGQCLYTIPLSCSHCFDVGIKENKNDFEKYSRILLKQQTKY